VTINFLDNPLASLPATWRILNAFRVAWKYVGLYTYPVTLSYDYSYKAIRLYEDWRHTVPAAGAAVVVLALWAWAVWARRAGWVLAGAIYFAGFAVTANILVPTGTIMGERLAYLPSAGFCLLVALIWIRLESFKPVWAWAVLAILLAALGVRTVVRNRDFRTNFTLFSAGVQAVPGSSRAHCNIGGQYMDSGQLDAALAEFQTALQIYPDYPDALEYSGLIQSRRGHDQEALQLLERAFFFTRKESTRYSERAVNLAALLMKLGQNDEAVKLLNQAIEVSPGNARAWSNRAVIHYWRGEVESARADAETALRSDPTNPQAQSLLQALNAPAIAAPQR
jgi:protein O-mannosyl-transferase